MTPPKDKPNWGGKRPNQTGRPPKRFPRVSITCRVHPKTKEKLDALATKENGLGRAVDALVAKLG